MQAAVGKVVTANTATTEMAERADSQSVAVFARLRPVDEGQERAAITIEAKVVRMRNLEFDVV
eukprot:515900-Prymnesium_polylepis.1